MRSVILRIFVKFVWSVMVGVFVRLVQSMMGREERVWAGQGAGQPGGFLATFLPAFC